VVKQIPKNSRKILSQASIRRGLYLILFLGTVLFIWELGSTGLFDETPPLFAAAGRAMTITGDWLTPRVNGLTRFDKPPLVYWAMGLFYSLPDQSSWDPLGTWAARLPSALSSLLLMLVLGDTLMRFPQKTELFPRRTALVTSLSFALSPLVLIWSRIAVSDALLCSMLGISLLFHWRRYADINTSWWIGWLFLGLAILTKGPVALVITFIIFSIFSGSRKDIKNFISRIKIFQGLFITFLVCIPWYAIELFVEGKAFWDSFFGYHNFQRLTSVVNSHQQPWWFYGLILVIASLPFTPFLIISFYQQFSNIKNWRVFSLQKPEESLQFFASCWLISIFLLFTFAATKLPSYWLPATPAASILIGLSVSGDKGKKQESIFAWICSVFLIILMGFIFYTLPSWVYSINDPEMPEFSKALLASNIHLNAFYILISLTFIGISLLFSRIPGKLIFLQLPFVFFQLFVLLPIWKLGDNLRQLPLREASELVTSSIRNNESLAMVGINKPSIHFYTKKIVLYESNDVTALVNLSERLSIEQRDGWSGENINSKNSSQTFLLIIDTQTSNYSHWKDLDPEILGDFSIYKVWRLDRKILKQRALELLNKGIKPNWRKPRPEIL
tara:strand:- start:10 stop:1854 length:1845 start_codon:yes stop_codon:yes gene_type:complete